LEEKRWDKIKNLLPRGYKWNTQWATRKSKKGRVMGGMIIGIRKEMAKEKEERKTEKEGIIEGVVKVGKEKWRIIGAYVKKNIDEYLTIMEKWMEEKREGEKVIIGGDFNVRTGREGGAKKREGNYKSGKKKSRKSKDKKSNRKGRKIVEKIEEWGWSIWNGNTIEDEEGEYTFTGGKGKTVIDYVIGDEETRGTIKKMKIGDKVDSDHHPLEIWVEGETQRGRKKDKEQEIRKVVWDREGQERFRKSLRLERREGKEIDEEWKEIEEKVKKALKIVSERQRDKRRERRWCR